MLLEFAYSFSKCLIYIYVAARLRHLGRDLPAQYFGCPEYTFLNSIFVLAG